MTKLDDRLTKWYFLNVLDKPVVLTRYLQKDPQSWSCLSWNKREWLKLFENESFKIQFGKQTDPAAPQAAPQWDYSNLKGNLTYEELLDWEATKSNCTTICQTTVTHESFWAYLDYYYMKDLKNMDLADQIMSWGLLGFPELKAKDSTIWIGTKGANTPCHIDTYGSNIVCQIYGKKRWTLFPKNQSCYLYPSRVPYEESSIYSKVGFPYPDMTKFPKLASTTPYTITLEPGDVLLVPKHWWHFVENIEFSISINAWIPMKTDEDDRLKEALVLYQIGSLCQSLTCPSLLRSIFNPNMLETVEMSSSELLELLKQKVLLYEEETLFGKNAPSKVKSDSLSVSALPNISEATFIKECTFEEYSSLVGINVNGSVSAPSVKPDIHKVLINVLTDDRVISCMKQVLDELIKSNDD